MHFLLETCRGYTTLFSAAAAAAAAVCPPKIVRMTLAGAGTGLQSLVGLSGPVVRFHLAHVLCSLGLLPRSSPACSMAPSPTLAVAVVGKQIVSFHFGPRRR